MKMFLIGTSIFLTIAVIVLYVWFYQFCKKHGDEEVGKHEKTLMRFVRGIVVVEIMIAIFKLINIWIK